MKVAILSPRSPKLEAYAALRASQGDDVFFGNPAEPTDADEVVYAADDPAFNPLDGILKLTKRVTAIGADAAEEVIHGGLGIADSAGGDADAKAPRARGERRGR